MSFAPDERIQKLRGPMLLSLNELKNQTILVTGGSGFLGTHLVSVLKEALGDDLDLVSVAFHADGRGDAVCDLTDPAATNELFAWARPKVAFHLAGFNGGIEFNGRFPADIFRQNTMMALNVLDAATRCSSTKKVVSVVASCAYPTDEYVCHPDTDCNGEAIYSKGRRETMVEDHFFDGPPHPSVACHGLAKRTLQAASSFYHTQYGLNAVCACPTTLYGPGDSWDPERTKVVGAMIRRFAEAKASGASKVICWGSGRPLRDLLYVRDAAKLLLDTMLLYNDSTMPLNLAVEQEVSVADLAKLVAKVTGYDGNILWDAQRPDGQMRKRLDTTRMRSLLRPLVPTPLESGLTQTLEDFLKNNEK
jgi:GDP-L-fucose synthase